MKHKTRYRLWLCLGYAMEKTAIVALDVVSAETQDEAMQTFMEKPELAGAPIAVTEVQQIATGRLERTWRTLRYRQSASQKQAASQKQEVSSDE